MIFSQRIFKHRFCFLIVGLLLGITACKRTPPPPPKAPTRAEQRLEQVRHLESAGATVVRVGDEITIIVPANILFVEQTERWSVQASEMLDTMIRFMNLYTDESIQIKAYTEANLPRVQSLALSTAWAQNVANYLWRHGLDTRVLIPKGYGACDPRTASGPPTWSNVARIELHFDVIDRDS